MSELIPTDAVEAIQAGVETKTIEVGGDIFTTREVHLPPKEPLPSVVVVRTLTGLVEFVNKFQSKAWIDHIHVASAGQVFVAGRIEGRHSQRAYYARADRIAGGKFPFSQYQEQEDFVIAAQTCFVPSETRAKLLSLVGSLKEEGVRQLDDDGVTQTVAVRQGISMSAERKVPNPVILQPFRTFPEIAQPESPFILRVRKGGECALFETADCEWELKAIQAIADFLKGKITDIPIIA